MWGEDRATLKNSKFNRFHRYISKFLRTPLHSARKAFHKKRIIDLHILSYCIPEFSDLNPMDVIAKPESRIKENYSLIRV
jgi:hypothetical protein